MVIPRRLEDQAFRQFCRDIVRHSAKCQSETDEETSHYFLFRRRYSNRILKEIESISNFEEKKSYFDPSFSILRHMCPRRKIKLFRDFMDFVFNKFVESIDLKPVDFDDEAASAVLRNCKELKSFIMRGDQLAPEIFVPFFQNMKQLTELDLESCRPLSLEVIEAISNSLTQLIVLKLRYTDVDDKALFVLSGHKPSFSDISALPCCYVKDCEVESSLRLRVILLNGTNIQQTGIACLLTHIPTLHFVYPLCSHPLNGEPFLKQYSLSRLISEINTARAKSGIPTLTFQLTSLNYWRRSKENWRLVLQSSPGLRVLKLSIRDSDPYAIQRIGDVLGDSDLGCLKSVELYCRTTETLFAGKFKRFWQTKGHQLTFLRLGPLCVKNIEVPSAFDSNVFRRIVNCCPNLKTLIVFQVSLVGTAIMEDFHDLPLLKLLHLSFLGEGDVVSSLIYKILLSAKNVRVAAFIIPRERKEFFENILNNKRFPCLEMGELRIAEEL